MKVGQYLATRLKTPNILLMDLGKAFDTVNRTILCAALYKKGLPIQTIQHIRRGHNQTTLQAKHCQQYGNKIQKQHRSPPKAQQQAPFYL